MNPFRVFPHPTFDRVNKLEEQWCRDSFSLSSRDSTTRLINDDQLANEREEKIKSGENLHGLLSLFGKTTTTTTTTWTIELCSSVKQRCRWNDLRSTNRTSSTIANTASRSNRTAISTYNWNGSGTMGAAQTRFAPRFSPFNPLLNHRLDC